MGRKLFLKIGDRVRHLNYIRWGTGEVVEEKHSNLPGGSCLVRIKFEDGSERSFINDMDNVLCCCHAGIRLLDDFNI